MKRLVRRWNLKGHALTTQLIGQQFRALTEDAINRGYRQWELTWTDQTQGDAVLFGSLEGWSYLDNYRAFGDVYDKIIESD